MARRGVPSGIAPLLACCRGASGRSGSLLSLTSHALLSKPEDNHVQQLKLIGIGAEEANFDEPWHEVEHSPPQGTSPGRICFGYCLLSFFIALLAALAIAGTAFFAPSSAVGSSICRAPTNKKNLGSTIVDKYFRSYPYVGWWCMPDVQSHSLLSSLHAQLTAYEFEEQPGWSRKHCEHDLTASCSFPEANLTWASGVARSVASAMYMGTAIKGVIGEVPEKLRGVFWIKGGDGSNGFEELAVFHYARWFADEQVFILPQAPFTRAWAANRPVGAKSDSDKYVDQKKIHEDAWLSRFAHSIVWDFRDDHVAFADLEMHGEAFGTVHDFVRHEPFAHSSTFTLEELPESTNGTRWKRGCYFGWNDCNLLDMGSFEMLKIISADGNFVQPHYDDLMTFMGETPLFVHSGWDSEAGRAEWANWYFSVTGDKPIEDVEGGFHNIP